jgi:hypothetical protein
LLFLGVLGGFALLAIALLAKLILYLLFHFPDGDVRPVHRPDARGRPDALEVPEAHPRRRASSRSSSAWP